LGNGVTDKDLHYQIRPAIVHYEIKHLDKRGQEEALERLLSFGYRVARSGGEDMLAVL
jgi:hypothetical protein